MAVKYYKPTYLAELFGVTKEKFHKEVKPVIFSDFKKELQEFNIKNPDIGVDENNFVFLSNPNRTVEIATNLKMADSNEH